MDMNLIDCLVMTLISAVICICLPKVLMLLQSVLAARSWEFKVNKLAMTAQISPTQSGKIEVESVS